MTARRWLLGGLAAAAVLLLAGRVLAQAYVDYRWFAAMGAGDVWSARAGAVVAMRLATGLAAALFVFVNLYVVRRSVVSLVLPRRVANLEIGEEVPGAYLTAAVVGLSVVLGALLSLPQDDWSTYVLAQSGAEFGETDPYFGLDVGFFVYWLPFEQALHVWTLFSVLIVAAMVLFLYALTPSLRWERGTLYVSAYVRRHVTVLAGVLLLMLAWSYRLDMYELLLQGRGGDGAFTYVDHVVGIPGSLVLAVITLGAALIVAWAGWTGQLRLAGGTIVAVLALSVIVGQLVPWATARSGVPAQAAVRERPYEATRAAYTRRAFAVDRIGRADSSEYWGSLGDAARAVAAWDVAALVRTLEASRRVNVVPGEITWRATPAGLVADVPERPVEPADPGRAPWTVSHILAWTPDETGGPVRVSADGSATANEVVLGTPIVFEGAQGYLVVPDSARRVVGSRMEGWLARLTHAWSFQKPGLLFEEVPASATVVIHRDLRRRVRALLPFFAQGTAVSPVIVADTLLWTLDLYAASATYPLARPALIGNEQRSYFHHAATVVVDALTGRMTVYADSTLDPIARTWTARFPGLFTPLAAMPASVRASLSPQVDALRAQAQAFGRFGTRADGGTPRQPPAVDGADAEVVGAEPPFVLPGGRTTAVAVPLVAAEGDRVRGALVALGGAERGTRWYPAADRAWPAIVDRLRGADSSRAAGDGGSTRGPVRPVPVAGDLAYVQSAYAWPVASGPRLARVAVLAGDTVAVGASLARMAGLGSAIPRTGVDTLSGDLRDQVQALYRAMRDALQRGDWAAFGRAFDQLGRASGAAPR